MPGREFVSGETIQRRQPTASSRVREMNTNLSLKDEEVDNGRK